MRIYQDQSNDDGAPNLTPMIDVVFLLLIFFLVATRFDEQERELPAKLPQVVSAEPLVMKKNLIVNITKDGKYKIVQKEYSERELLSYLLAVRKKNPQKPVLIRADGSSPWRSGVKVMGMCNKVGITDYKVAAILEK